MTTGSQKKAEGIQETPLFDKIAVIKFVDIGGYLHKGKQKPSWLLIITSLMGFIVITKLTYPLLLGFRCFFLHSTKYTLNLYIAIASPFELDGMQSQGGLLHIPVSAHPLPQSNSQAWFITNSSLAVSQSVWMVYSFNTANCLLEAKITRPPPSGGEAAA